ncbi:MAG: hypothetical protein M1818_008525 [Claussenomyces sp. TS43310]|nr:MAG: hypothetical protein M1818_008525 [Claussenomyces sp. TS43310]
MSRPLKSAVADIPSPTKIAFKVHKPRDTVSSGVQAHDIKSWEKMDPATFNVVPHPVMRPQMLAPRLPSGHTPPSPDMTPPVHKFPFSNNFPETSQLTALSLNNGPGAPFPLEFSQFTGYPPSSASVESATGRAYPVKQTNDRPYIIPHSRSDYGPRDIPNSSIPNVMVKPEFPYPESCCGSRSITASADMRSRSSSAHSSAIPGENCNSRVGALPPLNHEAVSTTSSAAPLPSGRRDSPHLTESLYYQSMASAHDPQTTVYAYPPSWGSYQHPLQPSQWRQSSQSNAYNHSQDVSNNPVGVAHYASATEPETFHSCSCGPHCNCVGCAAHPYNEATREYIRSYVETDYEHDRAYDTQFTRHRNDYQPMDNLVTMRPESNPITKANTGMASTDDGLLPSPPSGTQSHAGSYEEQSLSAEDYFFVNYPFSDANCDGDTASCPCGPDCSCFGCIIHNNDVSPIDDLSNAINDNDPVATGLGAYGDQGVQHMGADVNTNTGRANCCL